MFGLILKIRPNSGLILKIRLDACHRLKNLCKLGLRLEFGARTESHLFLKSSIVIALTRWRMTAGQQLRA